MNRIKKNNEEIAKLKSFKSEIEQLESDERQELKEFNEEVEAYKNGLINEKEFDEISQKHINNFDNFIDNVLIKNDEFKKFGLKK